MLATLANTAWLAASLPAHRRFRRALLDPAATQQQVLRGILARGAQTAYGHANGFGQIRSYAEFARRVPLVDYDTLEPWIERIMHGEPRVLTSDPVTHLVPTSGTTGACKLIPFTAALQREFNAAIGPWLVDLVRAHPAVALGPAYWSITPLAREAASAMSSVPIGFEDDRSYLGGARARLLSKVMAVPPALRHVQELDDFRSLTLRCLLRARGLRFVSVWHPSVFTLLLDELPRRWDELLDDLSRGGPPRRMRLPAEIAAQLTLPPLPRLAAILRRADPVHPETVWPDLRVVSCWADAHAGGAAAELQSRLPQAVVQSKGLLSTEAFVTLPYAGTHPLALCSHFFEFASENNEVTTAENLRCGEIYGVIVTTGGGLVRYRTGDRVELTGTLGRTPTLRFLGRGSRVSDLCGEKLSESFVAKTVREVCDVDGRPPPFALLAPEQDGTGVPWHYELFVAGRADPAIAAQLEQELRVNPHYALCRDLGQLGPVRVTRVGHDANQIYLAAEMARGLRLGDIKPAVLSSRPNWSRHFRAGVKASAIAQMRSN